jgi:hypothetical protein
MVEVAPAPPGFEGAVTPAAPPPAPDSTASEARMCSIGCSTTRARSRPAATTPMAAAIPTCLRPLLLARVPVRAADPGSEEPASLQRRQGVGLSVARTADRRAHQRRPNSRPLVGDPAGRRLDPYGHRDRLSDPAPARRPGSCPIPWRARSAPGRFAAVSARRQAIPRA